MSGVRSCAVLDTNLLTLLVVGTVDEQLISGCKRTHSFSEDAFALLVAELLTYHRHKVSAAVLAETCNLLETENAKRHNHLFQCLRTMVAGWEDAKIGTHAVIDSDSFIRFGFTDASLTQLLDDENNVVITDDFRLYGPLSAVKRKGTLKNFNHLRFAFSDEEQKGLPSRNIIDIWRKRIGWSKP